MAVCALGVFVALFVAALTTCVSARDNDCNSYVDSYGQYHFPQSCGAVQFCCGTCDNRQCCSNVFRQLTEDEQEDCERSNIYHFPSAMVIGIIIPVIILLVFICCCVCPCCCLYKICRKPQPVVTTTTHTTVVTSTPQHYPRQPTAVPGPSQSYQGAHYPPYQPTPVQPGYGTQQPMPTQPYQGHPFTPGPPPTYQEATGPGFPPQPMPYSQAAFMPGQTPYPLQPPVQPGYPPQPAVQPNASAPQMDVLSQPAYNPEFVLPPKTG